jgi:hypothetical protein
MHATSRTLSHSRPAGFAQTRLLLACGIAFPLLWIGMDLVASALYPGYSYTDQTVSELSAYTAPTRPFWLGFSVLSGLLQLMFAVGIWDAARGRSALRVVAAVLAAHATIMLTGGPFTSMHPRAVLAAGGPTLTDTLHLTLVAVGILAFVVEIAFASTAFGTRFRLYSIATIVLMLTFGGITSGYAAAVEANQPTPWVGIYERISAYSLMLWMTVLAGVMMRERAAPSSVRS